MGPGADALGYPTRTPPEPKPFEHYVMLGGLYSVTALYDWCLLFVLIRQRLRGGSGPQHLIGAYFLY